MFKLNKQKPKRSKTRNKLKKDESRHVKLCCSSLILVYFPKASSSSDSYTTRFLCLPWLIKYRHRCIPIPRLAHAVCCLELVSNKVISGNMHMISGSRWEMSCKWKPTLLPDAGKMSIESWYHCAGNVVVKIKWEVHSGNQSKTNDLLGDLGCKIIQWLGQCLLVTSKTCVLEIMDTNNSLESALQAYDITNE